jgi:hypothetical protein
MVAPDEPAEQGRATPACSGVDRVRGVVWVEPTITVEVQYNELMQGRLRDAVLRGVSTARGA